MSGVERSLGQGSIAGRQKYPPLQGVSVISVFRLLMAVMVFFLSSCTITRPPEAQSFNEITVSQPGFATLYIYRAYHDIGRGVWPEVFINEQKTVGLKNGSYTVIFIKPGKYKIRTEKSSVISGMDNIPGEFEILSEGKYFLEFSRQYRQFISTAGLYSSPSFKMDYERWTLVPSEDALSRIAACYFIQPYVSSVDP